MRNGLSFFSGALAFSLILAASAAHAGDSIPDCMGTRGAIPIINEQVITWKTTTPNEHLDRAHVSGTVGQIYPDKTGHHHFQLEIGPARTDTVEIIFNEDFGATPPIEAGMNVEACGDFINEFEAQNGYPASPDGAIIHWVHRAPNPAKHASGYIVIDGTLYGMGSGNGGNGND